MLVWQVRTYKEKVIFPKKPNVITYYDLKMTKHIAKQLHSKVIESIRNWYDAELFSLIYVIMGKDYLASVKGLEDYIKTDVRIENMGGLGLGQRKLLDFLNSIDISGLDS